MSISKETIKKYYDDHLIGKLNGYIYGNARVEKAWETVINFAGTPGNILEVGCGVGDISSRMSKYWPHASVTGIDISKKSIETANKLFDGENLKFICGVLDEVKFSEKFDLILLMDVFEHISIEERPVLYNAIANSISTTGKVILSFPTPEYLSYLKENKPEQIQPVDENISPVVLENMAAAINKHLLIYMQVSVWNARDYAHAVIGNVPLEIPTERKRKERGSFFQKLIKLRINSKGKDHEGNADARQKFVNERLRDHF